MLKRLNNWLYGIEQRIEKWGRLRNAYRHGYESNAKHKVGIHCNPWPARTDEFFRWTEGWLDAREDNK